MTSPTTAALAHGTVRVAIDRPEVRNAFRPRTVDELYLALDHARQSPDVGCVLLTGNGPSRKDGGWAFSSGGDQRARGKGGYEYEPAGAGDPTAGAPGPSERARLGRLHILQVQQLIRFMPKVVIAVVPGWAAGGGHSLHVVCDLSLASAEHARFRQTDADVASFDGGFGSAYLARQVGQKRAREVFFWAGPTTPRRRTGWGWSCRRAARVSRGRCPRVGGGDKRQEPHLGGSSSTPSTLPTTASSASRFLGEATRLAYMTEEVGKGRNAFLERLAPDWSPFPWYY